MHRHHVGVREVQTARYANSGRLRYARPMKVKSWGVFWGGATGRVVVAEGVRSSRVSSVVVGRGVGRRVLAGIWRPGASPVLPACVVSGVVCWSGAGD